MRHVGPSGLNRWEDVLLYKNLPFYSIGGRETQAQFPQCGVVPSEAFKQGVIDLVTPKRNLLITGILLLSLSLSGDEDEQNKSRFHWHRLIVIAAFGS